MVNSTKHILFTFDYELFLGNRSGTAENCILLPTQKLLEIFNKHSISNAIFFVDTTYLLRLKNEKNIACQNDLERIRQQIKQIVREGHYVFPHLHPHWIDAKYLPEVNQWDLSNTTHYSLHSISVQEREKLFSESVLLLKEICGEIRELGYRAGGWCIQPFSDFKPFFEKHNIKYDFTVMKGFYSEHESQHFDFREAPEKNFYRFSEEPSKEDSKGTFTEVPISSIKISYLSRFLNKFLIKLLYRRGVTNYGDGYSTFSASMAEIKTQGHEMASLENLTIVNLGDYEQAIQQGNYLQFISHPKMITPLNLACMDQFLETVSKKYFIQTDFKRLIGAGSDKKKKKSKVLIISFVFPPYPGIGGRRWAKFAKYLNKKEIEVHVISAQNPFAESSVWNRDVKTDEIHKTHIPHRYPAILAETPFTAKKRLHYRFALHALRKKAKGSLYDRGILSEHDILETASRIIAENNIDRIICTGAPFSILYYGTLLKKKFPGIKLMSDIRDPWTWGIAYGFGDMDAKHRAYEKQLEEKVIAESDYVTVPVQPMLDHLRKTYPAQSEKIGILPHGIDEDDIQFKPDLSHTPDSSIIKLIYSGTIYPGAEKFLADFSTLLQAKATRKVEFNIYTLSKKETLLHKFSNTPIHIQDPVPPLSLFSIISRHDYYVSFVTEQYKDFISTKYFEIISLKKPIILIAPKGILSDFIVDNQLGKHFLPTDLEAFITFLNGPADLRYNNEFNLDNFKYDKLSEILIQKFL